MTLLLVLAGCRNQGADSVAPAVEVITNAADIATARKVWADERERKLAALLQKPEGISPFDPETLELLREQRRRSLGALIQLRDSTTSSPETKLHAICALKLLGTPPSDEQLAQLGRSSNAAAMALLFELQAGGLYPDDVPLPESLRQFVADTVRSPDARARNAALHLAAWRNIGEARDSLLPLLQQAETNDTVVLKAAARLCPSPQLLQRLEQRLQAGNVLYADGTLGAIADIAETATDPTLKEQAASVCAAHLVRQPDQPSIDGDTMTALSVLAKLQPPDRAKSRLADLVRSGKWRLMRESALAELQKLDSPSAQQIAKETGLKLPPDSADTAANRTPWKTAEDIAAICLRHGLMTRAEADAALAASAARAKAGGKSDQDPESDPGTAEGFFHAAHRFIAFDVETGTCPNRHDLLLRDFAKASAGLFRPEAAFEHYEDPYGKDPSPRWIETGKGRYTVQFIMGTRLYRFHPKDLGDWYDVNAVLAAIDRALDAAAISQRFVALQGGGQVAAFVFANPDSFERAAPELGLTPGKDPDQARKLGKSYEEQVLKQLQKNRR